jgi:hypothetical protein
MTYRKPVEAHRVDEVRPAADEDVIVRRERVTTDSPASELHSDAEALDRVGTTSIYESLPARVNSILIVLLVALEGLLALRFTLVAFGANPASGFVEFILDVSYPFVRPFEDAFANRTWDEGVIEVSTLLGMGVWFLVFALIAMVLNAIIPNVAASETRVHRRHVTHL